MLVSFLLAIAVPICDNRSPCVLVTLVPDHSEVFLHILLFAKRRMRVANHGVTYGEKFMGDFRARILLIMTLHFKV